MFASGAMFATLLMLLLFPWVTNVMSSLWTLWQPKAAIDGADAENTGERKLREQVKAKDELLAQVQKQLKASEVWNGVLEEELEVASQGVANRANSSAVRKPAIAGRSATKDDPLPGIDGTLRPGAGSTDGAPDSPEAKAADASMVRKLFDVIVVDRPLGDERDFAQSLDLAKDIQKRRLGGTQAVALAVVERLLTRLSYRDVPIDPRAKPVESDGLQTDLAFLTSKDNQSILVTLRNGNNPLNFYFFELDNARLTWKTKVPGLVGRLPNVLTASSSGKYFLAARKKDREGPVTDLRVYAASRCYEIENERERPRTARRFW